MPRIAQPLTAVLTTTVAITALTACSGAGNAEAQAAYDACGQPDAELQLMRLDGNQVILEVTGDNAVALSGSDEELEKVLSGQDTGDGPSALAISVGLMAGMECLIEHTGYPGSSDQIKDGEEWDGWSFSEEPGTGSEFVLRFTAKG